MIHAFRVHWLIRFAVLACPIAAAQAVQIDIETVRIGNAGNAPSGGGFGAVAYEYGIGKYEVTAGQYATFLNAVASTEDTYGLYNTAMWTNEYGCRIERIGTSGDYHYQVAEDWANRPVNFVSWGDAARFANWLHNGQPTGGQGLNTTEDGAYYINGVVSQTALLAVARESDWKWALPTSDEWYKAAYYDGRNGSYYMYPTGYDKAPVKEVNGPWPSATYYSSDVYTIGSPYFRTEVGAHEDTPSPYGTFDQGGNVSEWNETPHGSPPEYSVLRGGSAFADYSSMWRTRSGVTTPTSEHHAAGFRVACLAELSDPVVPSSIDIGSRRELFVDDHVVDSMSGTAAFDLKKPQVQEVVLVTDAPSEGNCSTYFTVFQDGPLYRMYYRGLQIGGENAHPNMTCYAESTDGINWIKPNLGLIEFDGSTDNNIIWEGPGSLNFTPFLDTNPDCAPDAKYKAVASNAVAGAEESLYALKSEDGIHWSLMSDQPILRNEYFSAQNVAFWDTEREQYAVYHRPKSRDGRKIAAAFSTDFATWSEPHELVFPPDTPEVELYTGGVLPYDRAPQLLLGFPSRGSSQVEPLLMSSRDGAVFDRWEEPLIPLTAPEDRDGTFSNAMAWGILQLPHSDRELSVYATEAYYTDGPSRLRRFTYRVDGFVSANATGGIGEVLTKPLLFEGDNLQANFATYDAGTLRVELQEADGTPIPGFTLDDFEPLSGDEIDFMLFWSGGQDVSSLQGTPVRIRFELNNADLYSFQFVDISIDGDLNGDGVVNSMDLDLIRSSWGTSDSSGDANGDGTVGGADLDIVRANWGATAVAVPEPSVLFLLLAGTALLLFRQRW